MKPRNAIVIAVAVALFLALTAIYSWHKAVSLLNTTAKASSASAPNLASPALDSAFSSPSSVFAESSSGHLENASWSATQKAEIVDPQYQMTAYDIAVPAGWKFAGTIVRGGGCHANGAGLKYTMQSPDGLTAIVGLPGMTWTWNTDEQRRKFMDQAHCPGIDIDSAASFVVNIAVPNLHPDAKIVSVSKLEPEAEAALAKQLEDMRQKNATMAQSYGQQPQKLTLDGARVRVTYTRDGHPMEELISSVVNCTTSHMGAMFRQAPSDNRICTSRGTWMTRAPAGRLDALMASASFKALNGTLHINHDWDFRVAQDAQANFQKFQAANNAQFQANLKANQAAFDQRIQQQKQFDANLRASTDHAMAQDRARQNAIDASAHKMALYAGDQQEFRNPNTGEVIQASNQYNHQWISSDGSTLIQTNDHTYDPNGVVYPVSQSWSELVPK